MSTARRAAGLSAEREFLDSIGCGITPSADAPLRSARAVQRAIDASYSAAGARLPVGEARELAIDELMPMERAWFGRAWADTVPMEVRS